VIVLGNLRHDRHGEAGAGMRLGRQDLQLLSPLASGLAVTLGNATQVAQIKEEKSTLEQILGLSSDGILLLDGKGRVRVWNQAMERICGVAADDAVGLPYNELLAGLDHDGKLVRLQDLLAAATPASPRASALQPLAAVRGRGVDHRRGDRPRRHPHPPGRAGQDRLRGHRLP
jgi:PAS domain-containing protein